MHGISKVDVVDATEGCWHRLETIHPFLDRTTIRAARPIEGRPIYTPDMQPIPGWQEVIAVRPEGDVSIYVHKDSYQIIGNERILDVIDRGLVGVDYKITCVGTLCGWKKFFVSIDLDKGQTHVVNRDEFKSRLTFVTAHDGSMKAHALDSHTRTVCRNTVITALGEVRGAMDVSITHKGDVEAKLVGMEQQIETCFQKRDEFYTSQEYLATIPVDRQEARQIITGIVYPNAGAGSRIENRRDAILGYYAFGPGNNGETAYDLFNGFTQYWTHDCNKSSRSANMESSDFGTGAQKKREALTILLDAEKRNEMKEKGRAILASL